MVRPGEDPLIAAAEQTLRDSGTDPVPEQAVPASQPEPQPEPEQEPSPSSGPSRSPRPRCRSGSPRRRTTRVRTRSVPTATSAPRHEPHGPCPCPAAETVRAPQPRPSRAPAAAGTARHGQGAAQAHPRIAESVAAPAAERKGGVDRDALRRRLGGFQQGANNGRRDVEAEIADSSGTTGAAGPGPKTSNSELSDRSEGRVDETGTQSRRHVVDCAQHIRAEFRSP
ncbi:hypothetical protein NKH18_34550 [Streptomyces sp. M10(2022)]